MLEERRNKRNSPSFSVICNFSPPSPSSALLSFRISPKLFPLLTSGFAVVGSSFSFSFSSSVESVLATANSEVTGFLANGEEVEE